MGRRFLSDLTIFSLLLLAPLWQLNAFQTQGGFFGLGEFSRASTFSNYCFSASSESPTVEWNKTYGWPYSGVRATSVQQTSDGGYVFAGGSGWLFKLGADGNVLWNQTYSGALYDEARSIQETIDGGYIVAGNTNSFGEQSGALLIKLVGLGPRTWTVDDDGPADFQIIQEAINAASVGDIVFVKNGMYYEHVVVNKTLSIIGEVRDTTIIDGSGTGSIFTITQNDVTIAGFTIQNSSVDWPNAAVLLNGSRRNIIRNNFINTERGIGLRYGTSGNIINENNITSRDTAVFYCEGGYTYENNIIINNVMKSEGGISLCGAYCNNITGNILIGIDFSGGGYYENGIKIFGGASNIIVGNIISHVGWEKGGIALWSNNDVVSRNIIEYYPEAGMGIWGSGSVIIGNNLTNPLPIAYQRGIHLSGGSSNIIAGNTIANNAYGIWLSSSNNAIYHNNFLNNIIQVYQYTSCNNTWDNGYPSGGNYWSNYTGVDLPSGSNQDETGSDGIGDTPYVIDENNVDNYPLMAPYSTFDAGTWNGTAYNVDVVTNSTVSEFQFNPSEGALLRFNVTGDDGTSGFCRVTIPKSLLWVEDGWTVYVGEESVNYTIIPDNDYTYLYFTYNHSTKTVLIQGTSVIPEFPPIIILPLFMVLTMLAVMLAKRKFREEGREGNC
jgi:parallel beta-helix repeat protein